MTQPLTVLHMETGRYLYGGALQVYYLLRGLKQAGHRNVLVCPQGSDIAAAAAEVAEVHALPMRGEADLRFIAHSRAVIRVTRPDLIHLHSRRGADTLGAIAARFEHIPTVMTRRIASPELRWIARFKYRFYDRVVAISHGIYDVLLAAGIPASRLECVHSAVDSERYQPHCTRDAFLAEFNLRPNDRVIGMVARFIESKGHRHLLDAVPAIVAAFPDVRFLLFGQGPLESALRERIQATGLEKHVQIAGFRKDLEHILPCLELLVHPAELEGLGVSLLQAAASGIPIVATAVGGIPDVVRNGVNGLLLTSTDPETLSSAVIELLHDPEYARSLGQAGRKLVEQEFSITAMVEGNLRTYRRVLSDVTASAR